MSLTTDTIVRKAMATGIAVPAYNVPYLPMMKPIVQAVDDRNAFALIAVARLEWIQFESKSLEAVYEEFQKWAGLDTVRLHLDHIPVIDENNRRVDYLPIIRRAIELGYQSVMIDASRLDLDENIEATRCVVQVSHEAGIPCEAELGAITGHEENPLPYDTLYASGKGFTDPGEAARFVTETGCDWLSVAVGNIHGPVSRALRDGKKAAAKLNLDLLRELARGTRIPLVLHGGSGIQKALLRDAIKLGIAKVNVGTEIRQAYEATFRETQSVPAAQEAVYAKTSSLIRDHFEIEGTRHLLINE